MEASSNESTSPEPQFNLKKLEVPMPESILKDAKNRANRRLQQERQLFANIIFPSHIPAPCHPKVTPLVNLVQDLEISEKSEIVNNDGIAKRTESPFSQHEIENLKRKTPTDEIKTPMREIEVIQSKCSVHSRRADHFEKMANKLEQDGADKQSVMKAMSISKLFLMNYNYCTAAVSCPQRVAVYEHCFSGYTPDVIKAVAEAGQHQYLCEKERKATERCCGQKVQKVMRKMME